MRTDTEIVSSLKNLERYVRENNYSGFDPYDAQNSALLHSLNSKFLRLLSTQGFVYSPVNFRNFFQIEPGRNPKAIGIFLQAYCKLFTCHLIEKKDFDSIERTLVDYLLENRSAGYSGACWGFNFHWQDLTRYSKKGLPTVVVTSFIANSFLDLYEVTKKRTYLDLARNSCEFILKDLYLTKTEKGICFSYTPIDTFVVHNANALAAALLARVYTYTKEERLFDYAKQAIDFVVSYQKNDGSWAYSVDVNKKTERQQTDFHQGFILDALCDFLFYTKLQDDTYQRALAKGVEFYIMKQFHPSGYSYWRLPRKWPIDIHTQAQGIITGCILYQFYNQEKYLDFSRKIIDWTLKHMKDPSGYFYYQKWPIFTNKIPYMRWGQAWMMLAICSLLEKMDYGR